MEQARAYQLYSTMIKIRLVEEAIVHEYPRQEIRTPVHLYTGQEAIAAGVSINLELMDYVVSNHRSHGHCLARGMNLEAFFKELYGRQGGVSGGRGGSMHLGDMNLGIIGASAIVAGGIPIGAGTALTQNIKKQRGITVIYLGDGAVDEGVFWETVNFCALKSLPVLFVLENNLYASQTPVEQRHSYANINNIIEGYGIPALIIDGNDVIQMDEVSQSCIEKIRDGSGPLFMNCQTYRWKGHVGCSDDAEMGYRPAEELESWKNCCPILGMEDYLAREYPDEAMQIISSCRNYWQREIEEAIKKAREAPYAVD